jgi:hypothetical protein
MTCCMCLQVLPNSDSVHKSRARIYECINKTRDAVLRRELAHVCSRWKKAKGLIKRPEYAKMQHVRLSGDQKSSFWRFHTRGVEEDGKRRHKH